MRHRIARFVAVAVVSLAVMTIARLDAVSAADADADPAQPAALLPDDAVRTHAVGTQPPRVPDVGRASSIHSVRAVALAGAAPAAVLACVGACRRSGRPADDRLPGRGPMAWTGPGGRRAPPHARAA